MTYTALAGQNVVFRLRDESTCFEGKVQRVENQGLWIISEGLKAHLNLRAAQGSLPDPVFFLPLENLLFVMAQNIEGA